MMDLTLYGFPGSCSLASMIALEEAGWTYDVVVPNLLTGEHLQANYLAINPKGRVPALSVDGIVLTETPAILLFIADSAPGARLVPPVSHPMQRAQVVSRVSWLASSTLTACNRFAVPSNACTDVAAEQAVRSSALSTIRRDLLLLENEIPDQGYWMGGFSIADILIFFIFDVAQRFGVDVSEIPRLTGLVDRIGQRPRITRVTDWTIEASLKLERRHAP